MSEEDLGSELRVAVARLYRRFRSERGADELGDAAISVLTSLYKHGPSTLTELSSQDHVTAGSMSQTVNRLAASGYVRRTKDANDGRRTLIEATGEGRRVASAARDHRVAWMNAGFAGLTDEERTVLARAAELMRRLADS